MKGSALLIFGILLLLSATESARILVFFCESARSHHLVLHPVIRELALRGHEVDYYTHAPISNPPKNLNQIVFPDIEESMQAMEELDQVHWGRMSVIAMERYMRVDLLDLPGSNCQTYQEFQELLKTDKKYDMVIGEWFFYQEHFSYLIHRFEALGVAFSSNPDHTWLNEMSGLPDNPSYAAHLFSDYPSNPSLIERIKNTFVLLVVKMMSFYYVGVHQQRLADETIRYPGWESRPPLLDNVADLALILTNSHHSLGQPLPKAPHVKELMGSNVDPNPKPLTKEVREFIDNSEHGVIFFSMGSMVSVKEFKKMKKFDDLIKVFSSLKQRVIWKWSSWSGEEPPVVANILFSKWLPQQSILAHNKTKLFITHGGLGGLTEAITYGVPMIGIPFFADQFKNTRLMETTGFGIAMDIFNLTESSLSWAINDIVDNPRYKEEALRRSRLFEDRPMKPVEEAVYWIEYVLQHGKVLQPAAVKMPFYSFYLLDVAAIVVVVIIIVLYVLKRTLCCLLRLIRKPDQKTTKRD